MPISKTKKTVRSQMAFFVALIICCMAIVSFLPRLTIPLGISYIIFLILSPAIPVLMRLGLNKTMSAFVIITTLLSVTIIPLVKLGPLAADQVKNVQYYMPKVEKYITTEYSNIIVIVEEKFGMKVSDQHLPDGVHYAKVAIQTFLINFPKLLASIVEWLFLVPLFIFFLLKDSGNFKNLMLSVTPNSLFERFYYVSHQFNKQIGDYIFAKFIEASIVGSIITIGLWMMDIRFSLILGVLAGATNIIPYLGPLLGMVPALIFAIVEYGMGTTFGAIALLYTIANAIDIAIVFPILVSKIVDLHPMIVIASVIIGSQMLGVLGMVISIPCAAAVKLILSEIYKEVYSSGAK